MATTLAGATVLAVALTQARSAAVEVLLGVLITAVGSGLSAVAGAAWLLRRSERRLQNSLRRVELIAVENRAKASKHEYVQELALDRIEKAAANISATASGIAWLDRANRASYGDDESGGNLPRVLFVTSNGGGMGHIARCAAVLRHADGNIDGRVLTLSKAAGLVASSGLDVRYFPGQSEFTRGADRWRRQFTRRLLREISELKADAVVFDGTWVYQSITDAAEFADIPLVWLRRGLWRENADLTQVSDWQEHVTAVVTPQDIAEDSSSAPAPFRDAIWCAPVSLAGGTMRSREDALTSLGLDPGVDYALVQLSGGNDSGGATQIAVEAIRERTEMIPVVVRSPLYASAPPDGAVTIDGRFPLVDYAAAWAFTVTGAGYNSVHENLHTGTAGVYVPSKATITDDQLRRARAVHDGRLGLIATDADELAGAVSRVGNARHRREIADTVRRAAVPNGAGQVGEVIGRTIEKRKFTAWT